MHTAQKFYGKDVIRLMKASDLRGAIEGKSRLDFIQWLNPPGEGGEGGANPIH